MIIGKSLTALGGGGLKPEICVTAKAGALLNLHYKGSSIILQSYQLGASETTHTFVVSVSETAYMVEDATNKASVEVLVDAVAQFKVEIEYATHPEVAWDGTGVYLRMYDRAYYKRNPGKAIICGFTYTSGGTEWHNALLVSKDLSAIEHSSSDYVIGGEMPISYMGETWYTTKLWFALPSQYGMSFENVAYTNFTLSGNFTDDTVLGETAANVALNYYFNG